MVSLAPWPMLLVLLMFSPAALAVDAGDVPEALGDGRYPWYDARRDALEPVDPPWNPSWWDKLPDWDFSRKGPNLSGGVGLGQIIVIVLMVLALMLLVAGLVWAFRHYFPEPEEIGPGRRRTVGGAACR